LIWWADQAVRAQAEQAAIADLVDRSSWLSNVTWRLAANLQIAADFELDMGDRVIPLSLTYPDFFPDVPPSVIPRDDSVRLSGHQYGAAGELCLQYRPDNWTPEITGAMMIASAYHLLSSEQERDEPVLSEHHTLPAQWARGALLRFLYSYNVLAGLLMVEEGIAVEAEIQEHCFADVFAAQLSRIGTADAPIWIEPNQRGYGARTLHAWVVRVPAGTSTKCKTFDELSAQLEQHGFGPLVAELPARSGWSGIIIFDGTSVQIQMVQGGGSNTLIHYDLVFVELDGGRLDPEYGRLAGTKVAVVGCGSVGSKVAVHLARSGVSQFVLVDGDVLASGNLVRNELDWRAVGLHKASALAARLKEVRADCSVTSRTTVMGGQESGGTISATMSDIAGCDLIIDATADAVVFNLCAAISRRAEKPMCWAQVFGGGAGGIVVRLRPKIDPTPLTARQRIESWYSAQGVKWPDDGSLQPYTHIGEAGMPLTADDADVSVIASHLSRFAIDLLTRPDATIFPYSAYLIGLTEKWVFTAPFDVRPIDLGESDEWGSDSEVGNTEALTQLLADLLPRVANES